MIYQINWSACADNMTPEKFLAEYWQKKPLLIKKAFTAFQDPIEADELAGLAMEEEVESRIVGQHTESENQQQWYVEHGPFDDFNQFGEKNWTLLVQATNNWSASTNELIKPFQFIPNWRIDDVMVSFSTPHGGVGPHLDQYDVFIIQGQGKRRWQVGLPDNSLTTLIPHCDLKQVSAFKPIIDEITEAGDLLYIPPNHPHNGVSIENSLNYSIGFQAPNNKELWSGFADHIIDNELGEHRFGDKDRVVSQHPEQINQHDFNALKDFMLTAVYNDTIFNDFICRHLTTNHHHLDIIEPDEPFTIDDIDDLFAQATSLSPVLGLKTVYNIENNRFYINGEGYDISAEQNQFASLLAKNSPLTIKTLKSLDFCLKNKQLLTSLLNQGYWYAE